MNSYLPFTLFGDLGRVLDSDRDFNRESRRPGSVPVDISEAADAYLLSMDVPGINRDAIEVSVEAGVLTVKGERSIDYAERKLALNERWQGEFVRRFSLPDTVDQEQIAAKVENGVLALHLPKLAAAEPRRISVQ